jgi:hypothetical protein
MNIVTVPEDTIDSDRQVSELLDRFAVGLALRIASVRNARRTQIFNPIAQGHAFLFRTARL